MSFRLRLRRPSRALALLALLVAGLLIFFFWLTTRPINWQLSFTGQTEVAALELVAETQWDIGTAHVCARAAGHNADIDGADNSICGDSLWKALPQSHTSTNGRWLALSASPERPLRVALETSHTGTITMSLRSQGSPVGRLNVHGEGEAVNLPSRVNIIWPVAQSHEMAESVVLPFTGGVTAGRDVSWSTRRMLIDGKLSIFAASDESLAGRALAEEAALLPGDQIVLRMIPGADESMVVPKGFLRFDAQPPYADFPKTMTVVAFASAESALIQRFGGGEYDFSPGWWVRIKHRSELVIFLVLLTGALSIASSVVGLYAAIRKPEPSDKTIPASKKRISRR